MIVVKLIGGLGNQMFQYAFAMTHILKGQKVKFDLSYYHNDSRHGGFWLDKAFDLDLIEGNLRDFFYFMERIKDKKGNSHYQKKKNRFFIEERLENEFTYNSNFEQLDNCYFSGYWQNFNYFSRIEAELRTSFMFREIDPTDLPNLKLKDEIIKNNSISIHIRRGDYLQSAPHINLELEYYTKATDFIKQRIDNPCYYIFTDDIEWARENLVLDNSYFVEGNGKIKCHVDMYLMNLCKHNIIANSTFSWWSAWLNANPKKIVITPKKWFHHEKNLDGLLQRNWIRL